MSEEMDPKLRRILDELAAVVNRNSLENGSNTPDFVLAKFMAGCLLAWEQGTIERDTFYGMQPRPGHSAYAEDAGSEVSRLSARVKVLEEALEKMLSPEMDWENGEVGVGVKFRNIARAALSTQAGEGG